MAKVVVADVEGGERGGHGGDALDSDRYGWGGKGGGGAAAGKKERERWRETRETRCGYI